MTGVSLKVTLDDAQIAGALDRLAAFPGEPMRSALDAIGAAMESTTIRRFDEQHGPDGQPWEPSERVKKHGGKTLILHGYLQGSQTHNVLPDNEGVEWGSALIYAAIQQTGGTITVQERDAQIFRQTSKSGELKPGFVKKSKANFISDVHIGGHTITIPARPYLGVDSEDEAEIEGILTRHIASAIDGSGSAAQ